MNIFKNFENLFKKIAKICDIQKLKPIPWQIKDFSVTYNQFPNEVFLPLGLKNLNDGKKYDKKHEKFCNFCQKMLKFMMSKSWKPFHYH